MSENPETHTPTRPRRPRARLTPERQKLAARYVALARRAARPFQDGWPHYRDEFEGAALLALVQAAESFDPRRNVRFSTFAYHRIRGALRDVQRQFLEPTLPTELALDDGEPIPVEVLPPVTRREGRVLGVDPGPPVGWELEGRETLERWFRGLPRPHAEACRLIYVQGRTQVEAARLMGVSQSRLSAVHRLALEMLHHREARSARGGDGAAA